MMRVLTKIRPLNSIINLKFHYLGFFNYSFYSRYKTKLKLKHLEHLKHQKILQKKRKNRKKDPFQSLFTDITNILGPVNLTLGESIVPGTVSSSFGACTPGVRRNASEKNRGMYDLGDTQLDNLAENDVAERILEVVRGDHGENSMEERLDKLDFEMSVGIVGNVLKGCLREPDLGLRFFDWVKLNYVGCVTTGNYNTVLNSVGSARDFVSVERLMEEMSEYNCKKDVKTWTIVMKYYGKANLIGMALSAFQTMQRSGIEPDVEAYRILIKLLCWLKKGELALEFYKEMMQKGFELDAKFYRYLIIGIADCGDYDGVYLVANDMINVCNISEHDTYLSILRWFCIAGRVKEALELIRYLSNRNVILSPLYFETLVKGFCKDDRINDALEIVEIMKRKKVDNEEVYGALISGYLRKKDDSKALDLFRFMKEAGFTPLVSTYTELMQQHFNSDEYEKGCALFNELLETRVKLDTVAYTAMIAGHVRFGHVLDAWKVLRSMEEEGIKPTEKCFLVFVNELCKRPSSGDEIVKVLNFMRRSRRNVGQDVSDCAISYFVREKDNANLEQINEVSQDDS